MMKETFVARIAVLGKVYPQAEDIGSIGLAQRDSATLTTLRCRCEKERVL